VTAHSDPEYLTTRQVAERIGVRPRSITQALWRGHMPEPDLTLLDHHPLWLVDTIDKWQAARQKYGRRWKTKGKRAKRGERKTRKQRIRTVPVANVPRNAPLSKAEASPNEPLPVSTITAESAAVIAAAMRLDGHFCTTRDVQELAAADPDSLDWERQKLQVRVRRKIRGLAERK
jgi:hypothetical protein